MENAGNILRPRSEPGSGREETPRTRFEGARVEQASDPDLAQRIHDQLWDGFVRASE